MFRVALTLGLLGASVLAVGACDDDSDEVDDIDPTIVEEGDVPFDPAVPDGVDTDTNEVENQGFDDDDLPGPAGNVSELPAED
jgi:hypothetical protein